jgi:peptidoglycan/xylan/chitin deacetylase (PgdA/CDA1 family)
VLVDWLETLKLRPEAESAEAVEALPGCLGVSPPPGAFSGLCLSWDEVRQMAGEGVAFGSHTERHPILTRVTPDRARQEVSGSKHRLEDEVGVPVTAFAYPNGGRADVDEASVRLLGEVGFSLGFTLIPGPERVGAILGSRLALRRVYVHHGDYPARFAAKMHGLPRLLRVSR